MTKMNQASWPTRIKRSITGSMLALTVIAAPSPAFARTVFDPTNFSLQKAIDAAQQALMKQLAEVQNKLMQKLHDEANKLTNGMQDKLNNAISGEVNKITNGQVGKLMQNAGINLSNIDGTPGKVDTKKIDQQVKSLAGIDNIAGQVAAQTQIMLQNQMSDRLNVTSMLDEKPASGSCTTAQGDKCTILTRLREMDAVALDKVQTQNISAIAMHLDKGRSFDESIIRQIYSYAKADPSKSNNSYNAIFEILTPSASIPLGYERSNNAANLNKSMWVAHTMVGTKNSIEFLKESLSGSQYPQQVNAMATISKIQLARSAILNVHNQYLHDSLNAQFRACVVRPDAQDRIGATQEQQLVHIQSLLRCNNMIALQQRQQDLESQRLMGAMLLTLMDIYAVQQPPEAPDAKSR